MGLSFRAYARHRYANNLPGGSDRAVRNAINEGRISTLSDSTIDPVKADAEWAANTRQQVSQIITPNVGNDHPKVSIYPQEGAPTESGGTSKSVPNIATSNAYIAALKTQLLKLDLDEKKGKLVSADQVNKDAYELARTVRNRLLDLPGRLAPVIAAESDQHVIEQIIKKEILICLEELSR